MKADGFQQVSVERLSFLFVFFEGGPGTRKGARRRECFFCFWEGGAWM